MLDKNLRNRKPNRLKNYNYSKPGYYFVTICTKNKIQYFGKIKNNKMILSEIGKIAHDCWFEIPKHFNNIELDEFIVMPNHIHGIVIINENNAGSFLPDNELCFLNDRTKMLLPKIIQQYKSSVTRIINKNKSLPYFQWQKFYYDSIVRNEKQLLRIQEYVINNALKWELDIENPINRE